MRLAPSALVLLIAVAASRAEAQPVRSSAPALDDAIKDPHYTFCSKPRPLLRSQQRALCPLASEVEGCEALVEACGNASKEAPKNDSSLLAALAALAKSLVWLLVAGILLALLVPLIRALVRARRDRQVRDAPITIPVVSGLARPPPEATQIDDAEAALRAADEHARRGELARALSLYLAASLAALDRRGAIRLARHRTNGEYVRACSEDGARPALREMVREVDKVEFGHLAPTVEGVAQVAARAISVVRAPARVPAIAIVGLSLLLLVLGCGGHSGEVDDPAGAELPMDLLRRSGYTVADLPSSLATVPIPGSDQSAPVIVVDVARVSIESEAEAHLLRWVEAGGVLVLFGPPSAWPSELHASSEETTSRDVWLSWPNVGEQDGVRVATPRALKWARSKSLAKIGSKRYAASVNRGSGVIFGVAGSDLFTNLGVSRPANAKALVLLLDIVMHRRGSADGIRRVPDATPESWVIHVAREQDGVPPPGSPFAALVQAGLGKGAWHALAASIVLFLAFGIRQARARPVAARTRRAFAEHIEATGAFYGQARAFGHVLASYGRFAEMRVRERIPPGGDPVAFLVARAQVPHADAARVWKRATEASAEDATRGDELATIRDLGAMLERALEVEKS